MDYDKPFLFSDPYETTSISWRVRVSFFKLSIQKPGDQMKHERFEAKIVREKNGNMAAW